MAEASIIWRSVVSRRSISAWWRQLARAKELLPELEEVGATADALELVLRLEIVGQGHRVDREALVEHVADRRVYLPVGGTIEVVLLELHEGVLEDLLGDDHRGEDRPLGSRVLRLLRIRGRGGDGDGVIAPGSEMCGASIRRRAHDGLWHIHPSPSKWFDSYPSSPQGAAPENPNSNRA
jgi:hypothetical protein